MHFARPVQYCGLIPFSDAYQQPYEGAKKAENVTWFASMAYACHGNDDARRVLLSDGSFLATFPLSCYRPHTVRDGSDHTSGHLLLQTGLL